MLVRTGVAHGEATSAEDPPNKNVRTSEPCSSDDAVEEVEEVDCRICPDPSIKMSSGSPPFVEGDDDDDALGGALTVGRSIGKSTNSNNCKPMTQQMELDTSGNKMDVLPELP